MQFEGRLPIEEEGLVFKPAVKAVDNAMIWVTIGYSVGLPFALNAWTALNKRRKTGTFCSQRWTQQDVTFWCCSQCWTQQDFSFQHCSKVFTFKRWLCPTFEWLRNNPCSRLGFCFFTPNAPPLCSRWLSAPVESLPSLLTATAAEHVHVCFIRLRQNYVHVQRRKQNGGSKKTAFLPAPLTFRMVWHH